ncbi:MAG TPA: hypothetical protein PLP32_10005 [Accumulibacter sp.]|nr:hypothetical protein [Accumulibacter sp.]
MPAVRRTHAPAQRQERPILVMQPLPGLQRHAAGRIRQLQARPRAHVVILVAAAKAPDRPRSP